MKFPKVNEGTCPNTCYSVAELKKMLPHIYIEESCIEDDVDQEQAVNIIKSIPKYDKVWSLDLDLLKRMFCIEHLLEIRVVDHKVGFGVFAKEAIPINSFIGEYSGVVKNISTSKASGYSFGFQDAGVCLDAADKGNFTRYINHAIDCNLDVQSCILNGLFRIVLFSKYDIKKGEEILFDYGPFYFRGKQSYQDVFDNIYKYSLWGVNERGVGFSGAASLVVNARLYIRFLSDFLKTNNIKSVLDCGCGDWEFSRFIDWNDASYTGYDIVESIVQYNTQVFMSPNIKFQCKNVLEIDLPKADLLICKDMLQHIPNKTVIEFLKKLKTTKFCIITNDISDEKEMNNIDIGVGEYRCLDLLQEPFYIKGKKIFSYRYGTSNQLKQVILIVNENCNT